MGRNCILELICELRAELGSVNGWVVSGSSAMLLQGFECQPNDIDIWCTDDALRSLASYFDVSITSVEDSSKKTGSFTINRGGWEVEFTGSVDFSGGSKLMVDSEMLDRAREDQLQPLEDIISELLVMGRPHPKNDHARAKEIYHKFKRHLDHGYLRSRLESWGASRQMSVIA
ncbi:hypothetical protein VIBNISFn118_2350009 [Vibrio nigripulchritudo SFn118]|nr:hypothetical protein VIBNISFn118_2350009 [Vibrio nigripulchritudo SFn118]